MRFIFTKSQMLEIDASVITIEFYRFPGLTRQTYLLDFLKGDFMAGDMPPCLELAGFLLVFVVFTLECPVLDTQFTTTAGTFPDNSCQ